MGRNNNCEMMKVGPAVGILAIIMGLILVTLVFLYIYIPPPPRPWPMSPYAAMARDENSPDYTLKIIRLSDTVKVSDVELAILFRENSSVFIFDLENIIIGDPNDDRGNITYYDHKDDNKLSPDDSLILKIDYDGPNSDWNNDGNFTNDGPFSNGDVIKLIHKKTGGTMCIHTIYL